MKILREIQRLNYNITYFFYFYFIQYDFMQSTKHYLFLSLALYMQTTVRLYICRQPNDNILHPRIAKDCLEFRV